MNELIWRLHHRQAYFATLVLIVGGVLLLMTGITMANDYRTFLANCHLTSSCITGRGQLFSGDGSIIDLVDLTMVIPLLFGLFWGAPLVAKEYDDGTQNFVWTQGISRRNWLRANVTWALLAAVVWAGLTTVLVSWWRTPENALDGRFGHFDIQGVVPVAYAIFAVALGISAGALFRRVLPALASTLGIFVTIRVAVGLFLRPHYLGALSSARAPAGSWVISTFLTGPGGKTSNNGLSPEDIPIACQSPTNGKGDLLGCLTRHGFHQVDIYQAASRFWSFQGIESGIYVVLAVGLVLAAFRLVLARDA